VLPWIVVVVAIAVALLSIGLGETVPRLVAVRREG